MTVQTLAPADNPFHNDPEYYQGRADAYDDSDTRTVDQMIVLGGMAADYAVLPYALGYMDAVIELRLHMEASKPEQIDQEQTRLARKQGRERSARHTFRQ